MEKIKTTMFEKIKKHSLLAFLIILNVCIQPCFSQQQNVLPYIQSPNAASLGSFGNYDVSPFTGMPNVSIPVYSLKEGDIPVNCSLSYLGGGVKPSSHPGWVGQNWSLNAMAAITRKVNGGVDEVANSQASVSNNPALLNVYSYYYNYGLLNNPAYNPAWYSNQFVQYYYENTSTNGNSADLNKLCNLAPDEFCFTLPSGVSGSFYFNHLGQWVVKTKSAANLKIVPTLNSVTILNSQAQTSLTVYRTFYSFTITDEAGYIYTFGNSPNAIEFSRGPRSLSPVALPYNEDVVSDAWYITKIQSPTGNVVNYAYQRMQNLYVQGVVYPSAESVSLTSYSGSAGTYFSQQTQAAYTGQVISPVYLSQISSRTFTVNFNISATTELSYPYKPNTFNGTGFNYSDLEISDVTGSTSTMIPPLSIWYKLDNITVSDLNSTVREKYTFSYNNNSTERLFLGEFRKVNLTTTGADMPYHFTYNSTPLPPYNSLQQDQWGYYNGISFPATVTVNSSLLNNFVPSLANAQAGILQAVIYPTNGTTTFNYSMNDFSYVLQKTGNAITLASQTGSGGGLRVSSIVNTDAYGNSYTTQYVYQKIVNGVASGSSGVMRGYNKIVYTLAIPNPVLANLAFIDYDDYTKCLSYTDGRDVVYSEIQEILPDGSYKIFDYSNSDNPLYKDEPPVNIYSDAYIISIATGGTITTTLNSSYSYPLLSHSSRELERGQLLSLRDYTSGGILLKKTSYTYNSDTTRFNNYVRSFDNYSIVASTGNNYIAERYFQAVKIYTYYPYLKSDTTTLYDQSGANPVVTTRTYTYDNYRNKKTDNFTSSINQPVAISYNYPTDVISGLSASAQNAQTAMVAANMTNPVLEKITSRNGVQTEHERTDYNIFTGALGTFEKPSVFNKSLLSQALEPRIQYNSYDPYGHLLEEQKANDLKQSYLWGYNNAYPVVEVSGASYATISALVSQTTLNNPSSDQAMRTALNAVRTGLAGTTALVNYDTYTPVTGMTSQTDPTGKTTYYIYDGLNRLTQVLDINSNVVKEFSYQNAFQGITYTNTATTVNFTRNNCTTGYTGVVYPYTVAAGTYSSTFSQYEANLQAINYANANGQAAANTSGICNPNIAGTSNTVTHSVTVTLTNTVSGAVTTVTIQPSTAMTVLGNVKAGNYNISACQNSTTGTFGFEIGTFASTATGSTCIHFSNVPINVAGDGYMYVYPPGSQP